MDNAILTCIVNMYGIIYQNEKPPDFLGRT